jgi:hypothetical protein
MPLLNHETYSALARAAQDMDELGRMRTSTEHFGTNTRMRDRMLKALRFLEKHSLVTRLDHEWSSGKVTATGRRYLNDNAEPRRSAGSVRADYGINPETGGTRFPKSLVEADEGNFLMPGNYSAKLGRSVLKGPHRGMPIKYITLEEGATCPNSCLIRDKCYGGNMPLVKRVVWRGAETGRIIANRIRAAQPAMYRLHNLGDFPSMQYARQVRDAVLASGSAAFGFTHWTPRDTIGQALSRWAEKSWDRFAIRFSYRHGTRAPIPERSAVIIDHPDQAAQHNAVLCPEQKGLTDSCGSCGFCWHSQRPVAFMLHEALRAAEKTGSAP